MYFQRSLVVATVVKSSNGRAAFFATVHSASAFVIILLQVFATGGPSGHSAGPWPCMPQCSSFKPNSLASTRPNHDTLSHFQAVCSSSSVSRQRSPPSPWHACS